MGKENSRLVKIYISSDQEFKRCDTEEVVEATQIGFPRAVPADVQKNGDFSELEERIGLWFNQSVEKRTPNAYMLGEPYNINLKRLGRKKVFPVIYYIIE